MKFCFSVLCILFLIPVAGQDLSTVKVNYVRNDATLEEILNDFKRNYGIRFSYATAEIKDKKRNVHFEDVTMQEAFDQLLSEENLEYRIIGDNVLLRKSDHYQELQSETYLSALHIKGKIVSLEDTLEGLSFATLAVSNSSIGTYADDSGNFDLEIPALYKDEEIVVSYVGFEDQSFKIEEFANDFKIIPLHISGFSIEEITIVNREKPIYFQNNNQSIQLNRSNINNPTSGLMGNDIGRQIQLLAGIEAHDDSDAAVKIRGSNSDETLVVLDAMPLYNANHYYGIFTNINTAYIDSVNVFKNSYPLQYGGKTGGLVEIFSNQDIPDKVEGQFNIDLMTASGIIDVPLSDKSAFSIAGRSTIQTINNAQFNTVKSRSQNELEVLSFNDKVEDRRNDPDFTFYDLNLKYQYQDKGKRYFTFNFFRSNDFVQNNFNVKIKDNNQNELNLLVLDEQKWSNTAASMTYGYRFSPNWTWNTTSYNTQYHNRDINDFKLDKKYKNNQLPPPENIPLIANLGSKQNNDITDYSLDTYLEYKNQNRSLKIGFNGIHHNIRYRFLENNRQKLNGADAFMEFSNYLGYSIAFDSKLTVSTGLRTTYFSNVEETKFSPRIKLLYQLNEQFSLKSSFHIENQLLRQFYFEYRGEPMELWVSAGQNEIPILNSKNIMLGSTFSIYPFTVDVELYQKNMSGVMEFILPNPADPSNNPLQNREYNLLTGEGLIRGLDLIISSGYKNYDTYLSYTLSKNEERYKEIFKNQYFISENDRRHQFKWINTFTYNDFTFGINGIYVTGRPYTDIRNLPVGENILNIDPSIRLRRVDPYHRVDLSAAYEFRLGNLPTTLSVSVFNLMNHTNIKYIQSIATQLTPEQNDINVIVGNESELLNRTFNLGLNVRF